MFARRVSMKLKPNTAPEFTRTLEKDVIPTLRKQRGFQDEISFVAPNGTNVLAISLWDKAENRAAYDKGAYSEVVKMLSKVTEGTPQVEDYEVCNSTFHKIGVAAHV